MRQDPQRGPIRAWGLGPSGPVDRILAIAETVLLYVLCAVLFFMMLIISADALGRYMFNRPLSFTVDLVTMYLLPATMLLPVGLVLRRGGHIGVDIFALLMPARLYSLLVGLGMLAAVPVFWIMAYEILHMAQESWASNLRAVGMVPWPIWAEQAVFGMAMALFTLRALHIALSHLVAAASGKPEQAISILPDSEMREIQDEAV